MKKNLLILLIGLIVGITGTVIASNYLASEITYNDTTVENALNELYDLSNAAIYTGSTNITPTESEQILNTNGKRLSDNITIGAIPNTYKNLSTETTATSTDILSGKTAYDNLGNLITGGISTDCVRGTYKKPTNSQLNINFGLPYTKFVLSFHENASNRDVVYYYNKNLNSKAFCLQYFYNNTSDNSVGLSNTIILSEQGVSSNFVSTGTALKNALTIDYIACK